MPPKLYLHLTPKRKIGYQIAQIFGPDPNQPDMIALSDELISRYLELESEALHQKRRWPDELKRPLPPEYKFESTDEMNLVFDINSGEMPEIHIITKDQHGGEWYVKLSEFLHDLHRFIKERLTLQAAKPKRTRILTNLKPEALKFIEQNGGSANKKTHAAWKREMKKKDPKTQLPKFETWRSWWTHTDKQPTKRTRKAR